MRVIKATYGPSESGTTGTVIGGTIVGGTVIDTEGVERPPQPPGPSATRGELDQPTTSRRPPRIG